MTKIALTAAAILVATSGAFASDNFVPQNLNRQTPAAPVTSTVDHSITGSINNSTGQNVYKSAPEGVDTDSGHTIRGL
jgi:hypothetical protein